MNIVSTFSPARLWAIVVKEFIQMRRDRVTFGIMVGIPLLQLLLFGFAINSDPKHLATAVLVADRGPQGRTVLQSIKSSGYFDFVREVTSEGEGGSCWRRVRYSFLLPCRPIFPVTCSAATGRCCW
jgi:ABC-2 type transport system permease protein